MNRPATGSAACGATEGPEKAVNGSVIGGNADKWCSLAATKFLQVDLGGPVSVTSVVLQHAGAGGESPLLNTKDFNVQTSTDGTNFSTVATATGNTASTTTHNIPATTARFIRVNVTTPTQTADAAARIYELEVYSAPGPATFEAELLPVSASSGDVYRVAADPAYSAGNGAIFEANAIGDFLTYNVNVPQARTYDVRVRIKKLNNRGSWQLDRNGTKIGGVVDGFATSPAFPEFDLGPTTFPAAGNTPFRFKVTGKTANSTGYWIVLDSITLIPQ